MDTWGPGHFIIDGSANSQDKLYAISIGGGIIKAARGEGNRFHWSSGLGSSDSFITTFDPCTKILIGSVVRVNENCIVDENQRCPQLRLFLKI